jgi:hypothetical protein
LYHFTLPLVLKNLLITPLPFSYPYDPKNGLLAVTLLFTVALAIIWHVLNRLFHSFSRFSSKTIQKTFFSQRAQPKPSCYHSAILVHTKLVCSSSRDAIKFCVLPSCHTEGQHNLVAAAPHTTQLVTLNLCREHGSAENIFSLQYFIYIIILLNVVKLYHNYHLQTSLSPVCDQWFLVT